MTGFRTPSPPRPASLLFLFLESAESANSPEALKMQQDELVISRHCRTVDRETATGNWRRTRFESDGHSVHNRADGRPDFLRDFNLVRFGMTWN